MTLETIASLGNDALVCMPAAASSKGSKNRFMEDHFSGGQATAFRMLPVGVGVYLDGVDRCNSVEAARISSGNVGVISQYLH